MPTDRAKLALDVLDNLLEGCQVVGFDYRYLFVNTTVAEQAQRSKEELLKCTMMECFPGIEETEMFSVLRDCMDQRVHRQMENEFTYPDGSTRWFDLRFIPVPEGACILSIDITENKQAQAALLRAESQLLHAQKMEAVGRLAGGVAHDFNNVLSVILSYASLALQGTEDNDPIREDLEEVKKAAWRAANLTKQLLAFSRQEVVDAEPIDLNDVVHDVESMLRPLLGPEVELQLVLASGLAPTRADSGQLEQVILNVALNARDALPNGGRLTIETANVMLDADYARHHLGTEPGPHVMLAISDNGVGMDAEVQARIFEPFYTTKPAGKGTGLGLATVFGIVKRFGGAIWVYSEPGKGTTFKFYFPVTPSLVEQTGGGVNVMIADNSNTKDATILVAEDHDQLRRLVTELLEAEGYRVLAAASASEALELSETHRETIHLLLTDLNMPGMSGVELSERLHRSRPELLVIYMSGYSEGAAAHHGAQGNGKRYLEKPITPIALYSAVRSALQGV